VTRHICPLCAEDDARELCHYHLATGIGDTWARENRILCDLIHRGKSPIRLSAEERDEVITVDRQGWVA
jgi:hypothetical protein